MISSNWVLYVCLLKFSKKIKWQNMHRTRHAKHFEKSGVLLHTLKIKGYLVIFAQYYQVGCFFVISREWQMIRDKLRWHLTENMDES